MSKVLVEESNLTAIASAIRSKLGVQTTYKPGQMATAIGTIHGEPVLETLTANANGSYSPSTGKDGFSAVTVNVPNTYAAGDEGKVVSSGALVAQTARALEITSNGTYDTTTNNSVTVNVSGEEGSADKTKQSFALKGDCYVKSGFATNFISSGSLLQPKDSGNNDLVVNWSKAFKIHTRIKLSNIYNGSQALYGANGNNQYWVLPSAEIQYTKKFWFSFTTNGTQWTDEIVITNIPIVANGEYEITVIYDGTKCTVTVSDGTNTETKETTPSAAMYNNANYKIAFGGTGKNGSLVARYVSYDLDDTYIESEGNIVWGVKS